MGLSHRQRMQSASAIFDLEDRFARERGVRGAHPRPMGSLRIYLIAKVNSGVRTDYREPSELLTIRNPSGYALFFDQLRYRHGDAYRMDIEEGDYVVAIESSFYQRSEHSVHLPASFTPYLIDLEPSFNYPFPSASLPNMGSPTLLRGTVHDVSGEGMADVIVQVGGKSNRYVTDASGQWVLVFDAAQVSEEVIVTFQWPDASSSDVAQVPVERGQSRTLAQAGLRGWVRSRAGAPIADVQIQVAGRAQVSRSADDGSWFYYFDVNQAAQSVSVTARRPGGAALTQDNIQVQSRATVIVPTFSFA